MTSIDGKPVASREALRFIIAQSLPGSKGSLGIIRDGKASTLLVALGKLVENPNEFLAGIEAAPLGDEARARLQIDGRITGLLITKVADDSPYRDLLLADAVIVEIDRQPVTDPKIAKTILQPGRHLLLVYYRGQIRYMPIAVK